MAPSPPKPWETQSTAAGIVASPPTAPSIAAPASGDGAGVVTTSSSTAPPVPLRSFDTSDLPVNAVNSSPLYSPRFGNTYGGIGSYGALSSYSSPYSRFGGMGTGLYGGYGSSMYGSSMYGGMGYGGYGGYPGYGGIGSFGNYNGLGDPNSWSRRMEAGTQETFQIIESIVGAFGGFAQMLESTFMATHSSFFAMVSVAEQFGNLRDTLGSIFGIYTLMRYIRVAIAKLRGKPIPPEETDISMNSSSSLDDPNALPPPPRASKKPLIIFLLAVFGLPYLMGKLIRAMAYTRPHALSTRPFDPVSMPFYRATFDFIPQNPASEIPLRKGEIIAIIHPTEGGWWRARLRDGREGFVPSTYLEPVHNPGQPLPVISPPGEKGHAFIEEFKDE